jgi:zinc transport system ATP-binding protein
LAEPGAPSTAAAPLVTLERAGFRYDGDVALEGVDLVVRRGDRLALLGPNGGGKTTLLRLLLGLRPPARGRVLFEPPRGKLCFGYVPQFPGFDRSFPVRVAEMVLQGRLGRRRTPRDGDREAVALVLGRLGLDELAGAYLTELSGGELKRALVARALVGEPDLLVLDEPTASLDEPSRRAFWQLVEQLPPATAVVLATHDLAPDTFRPTRALLVDRRLEELAVADLHAHPLLCGHGHG